MAWTLGFHWLVASELSSDSCIYHSVGIMHSTHGNLDAIT